MDIGLLITENTEGRLGPCSEFSVASDRRAIRFFGIEGNSDEDLTLGEESSQINCRAPFSR